MVGMLVHGDNHIVERGPASRKSSTDPLYVSAELSGVNK